jgi:hypothetical protein
LTPFVSHPFLNLSHTDSDTNSHTDSDTNSHTDFELPEAQQPEESQQPEKEKENEKAWMDTKTKQVVTDLKQHIEQQIPQTHPEYPNYTIMKKEYWKLTTLSLVYVPRNKEWFQAAQPIIQKAWETILENRVQASNNNVTNYFTQIVKEP